MQAVICHRDAITQDKSDLQILIKIPRTSSCDVLQHILKQLSKDLCLKISQNTKLYTMQAVICHRVAITQDKSDRQILKKSRGRPHVTSFNIFCNGFKKIAVQKSPKKLKYIQCRPLFVTGLQ